MATTSIYCDIYKRFIGFPKSTSMTFAQRIRADSGEPPLMRRGKQGLGALDLNAWEVANWTIALCAATATTRKSPDAIETVKFARAAVRLSDQYWDVACLPEAIEGLSIAGAKTFGEFIDSIIYDMRSGAYRKWSGCDEPALRSMTIRFFNGAGGRIVVNLYRRLGGGRTLDAALIFRGDNPADACHSLTYIHELDGEVLEFLAMALGPPDEEKARNA
jgi:hypothetical protein